MANHLSKLNSFAQAIDRIYLTLDQAIQIYSKCARNWEFIDWNIVPMNLEQQKLKARLHVSFDNLTIALEVSLQDGQKEWRK